MMHEQTGKWIIAGGVTLVFVGLIYYFAGDKLQFLGRLPGDIRVEKENFKFYFPITTMILCSLLVNIIVRLLRYL